MTAPRLKHTSTCVLTNYKTWDEVELDGNNSKRWHSLTDQDGKEHYLDFSPYAIYESEHIQAFIKCAELLGRVPSCADTRYHGNFEPAEILTLLDKLELIKDLKSGTFY